MDLKEQLKQRFNTLYPDCTLYEVWLHCNILTVLYKDSSLRRHIDYVNTYNTAEIVENYNDEGGNLESTNLPKTKQLFEGIDSTNDITKRVVISYKDMHYWTCPF